MVFGKTERRIILSKIVQVDTPDWSERKIFFTIAFDIIESAGTLFIVDLGCTIIFSPDQQYRVVARSSIEIKSDEGMSMAQLRIKAEEEMPELEELINDDMGKYTNDFKISYMPKSSFSIQEIEAAISDVLKQGS